MYDRELLSEILQLTSYDAISHILNGYTLTDFQCVDILTNLARKRGLITYETGMGKTLIASAIMKCLKREKSDRRFIFIVQKSQTVQTPLKIKSATGLEVLTITSEGDVVDKKILSSDFTRYDVLIMTKECLNNIDVMATLLTKKDLYCCVFIDEAHELSNFMTSTQANMLRSMIKNFEYRYALTATPITSKIEQFANLCHILDRSLVEHPKEFTTFLEHGGRLGSEMRGFIVHRSRRDAGIISNKVPHIEYVKAMPHQKNINSAGFEMFKVTKGPGADAQADKTIDIILNNRPNRGLIYVNQHIVREFLESKLIQAGIRYQCINGKTPLATRAEIISQFEQNKLDVIITSVTTSNDLDCDYVIFYEFCVDVKQMIGRAERGLNPKTLHVYFIFTVGTGEIDFFDKNIYRRSVLIQDLLGQDYSEIVKAGQLMGCF